jgi:hypothetical protein
MLHRVDAEKLPTLFLPGLESPLSVVHDEILLKEKPLLFNPAIIRLSFL